MSCLPSSMLVRGAFGAAPAARSRLSRVRGEANLPSHFPARRTLDQHAKVVHVLLARRRRTRSRVVTRNLDGGERVAVAGVDSQFVIVAADDARTALEHAVVI